MIFRLRTIEYTADGRRIVRDRNLDKPAITIGRAAENDIHLTDLAVDTNHARIEGMGAGHISVTALGSLGFTCDGKPVDSAKIDTQAGADLRFGGYGIAVSRDDDGATLLVIQQSSEDDHHGADKSGFSLTSLLPGKRRTSWILAMLVLVAFLAWPIASQTLHQPGSKHHVSGDASWTVGPLSKAHHGLENSCESCHVKAFESVRDQTCIACHKDTQDHAAHNRLAAAHSLTLFGRMKSGVAQTFGKPAKPAATNFPPTGN